VGPMLISALLQNAQSLIDLFWVGKLGPDAVAALALSGTILFLMWPLVMGLSVGTVALVARYIGAGNHEKAAMAAGQSMGLSLLAGVAIGGAGLLGLNALLRIIGAEPAVAGLSRTYLAVSFLGYSTVFLLAISSSAAQAAGNAMIPMAGMVLANLINLVLDPIMIFGWLGCPAMGVRGAALATVLSQAVACALVAGALMRGIPRLKVSLSDLAPRLRMGWDLFRIGIFSAAQMLARSLMTFVLFKIVAASGTVALAGYGIGMRFHQLILLPCFVLGNAAATLVGQNLGAGRPDRSVRAAWLACAMGIGFNLAAGALIVVLAPVLTGFFTDDPAVIAVGVDYLRMVSPFYIFVAMGIILGRGMNGAGDTVPTMIITIVSLWGIQVPLAHALARVFNPATDGVWWSIAITNTLNGLITAGWFMAGRWKKLKLG
jgi:putative MATE family efflux protein